MPKHTHQDWYIILNPMAGGGKAQRMWPEVERLLKAEGMGYTMVQTQHSGHGIALAREAVLSGYRKFLAVGGDGTNNEVVNGIFSQREVPPSGIIHTLLPVGTGNDWARTYRIPRDFRKWIPLLKQEKLCWQDLGRVEYQCGGETRTRYFMNVAGMAYDGFLVKKANETQGGVRNKLKYLLLLATQLFQYKNRRAAVIFEGHEFEAYFYAVNVGICKYSGGGMQLVPHAVPDDGLLALSYDIGLSKLDVIAMTPRLFWGNLAQHPKVRTHQVKTLRVEAREERPTYLEADGEFLGETPCTFSILPRALQVVIP